MKTKFLSRQLSLLAIGFGLLSCDVRDKENPASSESTVSLAPRLTRAENSTERVLRVDSVVIQVEAGGKTFTKGAAFDRGSIQIDGIPVNTAWKMTVKGIHKSADGVRWAVWWSGVDTGTTSSVPRMVEWPSIKVVLSDTATPVLAGPGVPSRDTLVLPFGTTKDTLRFQLPATDTVFRNDELIAPSQVVSGYASYVLPVVVPSVQHIKVVTSVGNVALDTFRYYASSDTKTDPASPSIVIASPDSAVSHSLASSIVVNANVDSRSGVDSVVSWSGSARVVQKSGPPWSATLPLSPGQNFIVDSVYARNGKTAFATIIVYTPKSALDSIPPVLKRKLPVIKEDSVDWATRTVILAWKVHDADGKIRSVGLRAQPSTETVPGADSIWSSVQPLKLGKNVFVVVAKDTAGNSDSDSVVVVRRASPQGPALSRGPNTGESLLPSGTKNIQLSWSVADTDDIVSITVNGAAEGAPLNGTTVNVVGTTKRCVATATMNLTPDSVLVRMIATDSSGNASRDSFLVRVAQAPQATRILPSVKSLTVPWDSLAIHFSWSVARTRGLAGASLFANGAAVKLTVDGTNYSAFPNLQVGKNTLEMVVADSAGDTLRDTVHVERLSDPFHPEVTWLGNASRIDTVSYKTTSYTAKWNVVGKNTPPTVMVAGQSTTAGGALQQSGSLFTFKANLRVWAPGYDTVFRLIAVGAPGDTTFDSVRVVVAADTNRPVVTLAGGSHDVIVPRSVGNYTAAWTVSDPTLESVTINGVASVAVNGVYSKSVALGGDSMWVILAAKDSSGFVERDSVRIRRLAPVAISGAGDTLVGSVRSMFRSNLADAHMFYSTDRTNWNPYPSGGILVSTSQFLYAKDSLGATVLIDSARFLFLPTISYSAPTAVVSASGAATIEDSTSSQSGWNRPGTTSANIQVSASTRIYARARLGGVVTKLVQAVYAMPPSVTPPSGNYAHAVDMVVADPNADSVQVSPDGYVWRRLTDGAYRTDTSGTFRFRSWIGGQKSSLVTMAYQVSHDTTLRAGSVEGSTFSKPITINSGSLSVDSLPCGASRARFSLDATDSLATIYVNGDTSTTVNLVGDSADVTIKVVNGASWKEYTIRLFAKKLDTITDTRDGQRYPVKKLGTQAWMVKNLNFRNSTGSNDTTGVCYGYSADSCEKFGRLYSWSMVDSLPITCDSNSCAVPATPRGICPVGWHVPSFNEWKTFTSFVGDNSAGLKSIGWGNGDNSLGFNLAGGGAYNLGTFNESGESSYFWTGGQWGVDEGLFGYIRVNDVPRYITYKKAAWLSLRCIAD